jgi:carbamoylphosphate synthase large subunit
MPKRTDISTILIIGAGPIIIGQACEFDYSGTQACKALRAEGYRIVLINSNPATIMTDPDMADRTYIEPITPEIVEKIIAKERYAVPGGFALLPTMGGQTALNCALSLRKMGALKRYDVEMIGASAEAIDKAEDRKLFREAMTRIGLKTPRSHQVKTLGQGLTALDDIGLPAIIRPSFTLGGTGGGIAYTRSEFIEIVERGMDASPTDEVLVEESVLGWKEFEMEVVRDKKDNCIIICSIENIDPMGVHTGDSITVAPALTLTDKEFQIMRDASIAVLREIGVETGGSNVQFAVNPADGRMVVIEMNPRVSRSSALASKATGFPIAKVAAKLAVGYTLDEIANDITGGATPASFEPTIDYIVTKIPRFAFEKFPAALARDWPRRPRRDRNRRTGPRRRPQRAARRDRAADARSPAQSGAGHALGDGRRRDPRREQDRPLVPRTDRRDCRARRQGARSWPAARCGQYASAEGERLLGRAPRGPCWQGRSRRRRGPQTARRSAGVQAHRHLRRRVRFAHGLHVFDLRSPVRRQGSMRSRSFGARKDRHPRRRPEPDRAGDRVRLLLLPRLVCAERGGLRDDHDQLQSGDRLDRL